MEEFGNRKDRGRFLNGQSPTREGVGYEHDATAKESYPTIWAHRL
jgi:hypothetical protein